MIPSVNMAAVRGALVKAMEYATAPDEGRLIEVLADTLGYIKRHYRGPDVPGLHVNTRQGFLIIGGGNPSLPAGEDAGEAKAEPPPMDAPAAPPAPRGPRLGYGHCQAWITSRSSPAGKVCGGLLMMVGDAAVCQLCGAETVAREAVATPPPPPVPAPIVPRPRPATWPPHHPARTDAPVLAIGRPVGAKRAKGRPKPDPAPEAAERSPEGRVVDTSTAQPVTRGEAEDLAEREEYERGEDEGLFGQE